MSVCPSCGYCPCCGRTHYQTYPQYQQPYIWGGSLYSGSAIGTAYSGLGQPQSSGIQEGASAQQCGPEQYGVQPGVTN
jgi:hypothetical protein